jgi:hypothetical protein
MRSPSRIAVARLPRISSRRRTGGPPLHRDETSLRVLLWLAMIVGLLAGFALAIVIVRALSAL